MRRNKIRIFNLHPDMQRITVIEDEFLISVGIGRKPVLTINLLAISFYVRVFIVFVFRYALAARLYNLEISILNPHSAKKKAFLTLEWRNNLRGDVEDVKVELVNFFLAQVLEVVLVDFGWFQCKWSYTTEVVKIFLSDIFQGGSRRDGDFLKAISTIVKSKVRNAMELSNHTSAHAQALQERVATEGIVVQRLTKSNFFAGESIYDARYFSRW